MNASDFVKWLSGFIDACGDAPTPEQWAKIREKVGGVLDPVSAPLYVPHVTGPSIDKETYGTTRFDCVGTADAPPFVVSQ